MTWYRNPLPTVDLAILLGGRVVLIRRRNPPLGWALPGGFVEYGESLEAAGVREAREETGLAVRLREQFFTYSAPERDPRHHTITTVFLADAEGTPRGGDDAVEARAWEWAALPADLCFDHRRILADVRTFLQTGRRPGLEAAASPQGDG